MTSIISIIKSEEGCICSVGSLIISYADFGKNWANIRLIIIELNRFYVHRSFITDTFRDNRFVFRARL